ncbi:SMI1/KNR4 family protein [Flavobacterium olei]|uniref:SMI1/KNR4 family protein n=1 Tax=Flavobacterium olei TaxID=1886782 RepID=UPI00321B8D10
MTKLELSKTGFQINNITIEFPIDISVLKQALGDCRQIKKQYNHIFTWDDRGIVAFSKEGQEAESLAVEFEIKEYDFCAKSIFAGEFIFDGQEILQYYKNNKNELVKLFKGDRSGALVRNGISVWFDKEDDKITSLSISAYEEKEKKISANLDSEFKIFEPLWNEWILEINKIVPTDNDYYNLTEGISEEDIENHSTLEDGITVPPALLNFYKIQNVEYDAVTSAFQILINNWPYELIPFEDIAEEWNSIQDLQFHEDDLPLMDYDLEKININNYANPKWIPFATGRNGDYLLFDADPAPKGKFGQIIELQNESWSRDIVAESLEELIQNEINNLKTGNTEHFDFIVGKEN